MTGKGKAGSGDSRGGVDVSDKDESIRARDLRLKGADALVYTCAARLGLKPMVLRLVWSDEYGKVRFFLSNMRPGQLANGCSVSVFAE